jgi:hypothetical protein
MGRTLILVSLLLAGCPPSLGQTNRQGGTNQTRRPVTWEEISSLPAPPADRRIAYGSDPLNFGDLRLPGVLTRWPSSSTAGAGGRRMTSATPRT